MKKLIYALLLLALSSPANALSEKDFKPFLGEYDFYHSHAKDGDIALLVINDEGATFSYIVNLKTRKKYPIIWDGMNGSSTNNQIIFFAMTEPYCPLPSGNCPGAGAISAVDFKNINIEYKLSNGKCLLMELHWSDKKNGFVANSREIGNCLLKNQT